MNFVLEGTLKIWILLVMSLILFACLFVPKTGCYTIHSSRSPPPFILLLAGSLTLPTKRNHMKSPNVQVKQQQDTTGTVVQSVHLQIISWPIFASGFGRSPRQSTQCQFVFLQNSQALILHRASLQTRGQDPVGVAQQTHREPTAGDEMIQHHPGAWLSCYQGQIGVALKRKLIKTQQKLKINGSQQIT